MARKSKIRRRILTNHFAKFGPLRSLEDNPLPAADSWWPAATMCCRKQKLCHSPQSEKTVENWTRTDGRQDQTTENKLQTLQKLRTIVSC